MATAKQLDDASGQHSDLVALGWDDQWAAAFAEVATETAVPGRVRRVDRGECDVLVQGGEVRAMSDSQRSQSDLAPATGDWAVLFDEPDVGLVVQSILPRRSAIVRRDPAEEVVEQVLVANVDHVGVVCGVDRPLNLARIERFLVLAMDSGASPLVVKTKMDLARKASMPEWQSLAEQIPDVPIVETSSREADGLAELQSRLHRAETLVLLGESGAGKSALVNALAGELVQPEGEVRGSDAKGRHTTTARELQLMPGGAILIDTPGIRGVGLWDAEAAVARVFADITDRGVDCRFNDCSHIVEPDCAVQEAVEDGSLLRSRYERWIRLNDELAEQAEQREQRRRNQRGRRRRS